MSDQEQKKESTNISPRLDKQSAELSEEELQKVSGGIGGESTSTGHEHTTSIGNA